MTIIDRPPKATENLAGGRQRPPKDLTSNPDVLFYCLREYSLVISRKGFDPLEIARVVHGSRDVASELIEDDP